MGTIAERQAKVAEALKGNHFWKLRTKHGRDKAFIPETLALAANEYMEFCADNPLISKELVKFKGGSTLAEVPKMRAPTLKGLFVFLHISEATWNNYKKMDDYKDTCESISNMLHDYKLQGAAADLFNSNIITRDLQLAEHTKLTADLKPDGIKWVDNAD